MILVNRDYLEEILIQLINGIANQKSNYIH